MSRLIDMDPQIQPKPEPEGYEFGYYTFDQLLELEVSNVETAQNLSLETENKDASNDNFLKLPIGNDVLHMLQQDDVFCKNILNQIEKGNIVEGQLYLVRDKILKRYILDGDNTYETTVVPKALTAQILRMAHDELGHNGNHRTYTLHKRLYYWKGLKPSVEKHIKMYYQCQ